MINYIRRDKDSPTETASDPPTAPGEGSADEYVDAYRLYYANDKRHLFAWATDRSEPTWVDEYAVEPTDGAT